ncbi:ECF-type riboflavin transporter substrate-binding protein [Actinomycetaceae bacterium TAE3-ERU4]|nr:ECF-type riboflavin transporter substrate-binding protein [Actinomycetaceae bacterium TAE3-ERU4]
MTNLFTKQSSTVTVVATGIGAALFFVLGRFVAIPSPVPNTSISLQYAILAVFALLYGPVSGFLIGFIGHLLIDATSYGPWYSWEITSAVVGLIIGIALIHVSIDRTGFGRKQILLFNGAIVLANAVGWFLVAPILDIVLYAEPANKVFTQGLFAGVSNIITSCVLGTLLVVVYAQTRTKSNSLKVES